MTSTCEYDIRFGPEGLPGTNRAWLLGVYVVTSRILHSLYGIIYVTWYTSDDWLNCEVLNSALRFRTACTYPRLIAVAFDIPVT